MSATVEISKVRPPGPLILRGLFLRQGVTLEAAEGDFVDVAQTLTIEIEGFQVSYHKVDLSYERQPDGTYNIGADLDQAEVVTWA